MIFKKILLCALCLAFACLGFGCEREPEYPDFGEEGAWAYSEKLSLGFGGNAGGLSMTDYIARANEAAKDWPEGLVCWVLLNEELIMGTETEFAFDEQTNAFLTCMKGHERLIREGLRLSLTWDTNLTWAYQSYTRMAFGYGCKEFLGLDRLSGPWEVLYSGDCLLESRPSRVREEDIEHLIKASESPLVERVIFGILDSPEFTVE